MAELIETKSEIRDELLSLIRDKILEARDFLKPEAVEIMKHVRTEHAELTLEILATDLSVEDKSQAKRALRKINETIRRFAEADTALELARYTRGPSASHAPSLSRAVQAQKMTLQAPEKYKGSKDKRSVTEFVQQVQHCVEYELHQTADALPGQLSNLLPTSLKTKFIQRWRKAKDANELENGTVPSVLQCQQWLISTTARPNLTTELREALRNTKQFKAGVSAFDGFTSSVYDAAHRLELNQSPYPLNLLKEHVAINCHAKIKKECGILLSTARIEDPELSYDEFVDAIRDEAARRLGSDEKIPDRPRYVNAVTKGGKGGKGGKGERKGGKGGKSKGGKGAGKGGKTKLCIKCAGTGHFAATCLHDDKNKNKRPATFSPASAETLKKWRTTAGLEPE